MLYEDENALLWKWGFHLAYDPEDADEDLDLLDAA